MKKTLLAIITFTLLLCLILSSCGQKAISRLEVVTGLDYTYDLNETPDFSAVQVKVAYNDGSFTVVGSDKLTFSGLDTATAGTKNLIITYEGFSITVKVTVAGGGSAGGDPDPVLQSISYLDGVADAYLVGDTVDLSAVRVSALYDNGQVKYIGASDLEFLSSADTATAGEKTVTVAYGEKTTAIHYTVYAVTSLSVSAATSDTVISLGDTFDTSKLVVVASLYDGTKTIQKTLSAADGLVYSAIDSATVGKKTLTVSYKGVSGEIAITVNGIVSLSVQTKNFNPIVMKGESFDFSTLTVEAVYFDSSKKTVAIGDITFSDVDTSVQGETSVMLTYQGVSSEVALYVDDLKGIEIVAASINTVRPEGDDTPIDYSSIRLIGNYYYSPKSELTFALEDLTVTQPDFGAETKYFTVSYLGKEAKIKITETDPVIESIEVTASNAKVYIGNDFDAGVLEIYAVYSNGARVKISSEDEKLSVGTVDVTAAGVQTLTVRYENFEDTLQIQVIGIRNLSVDTTSVQTVFLKNSRIEDVDFSSVKVTPIYEDGTLGEAIPFAELTIESPNLALAGEQLLTVEYLGATAKLPVTVKGIASLVISGYATKIVVGDLYPTDVISVIVQYTDGSSESVQIASNLKFEIDTSVANDNASLKVTYYGQYEEKTETVAVKVLGITSIAVKAQTLPDSVRLGDTLNTDALVIIATLSDGSQKEYGIGAEEIGATVTGALSEVGKKNDVTVTFRGVSTTVGISVTSADADYIVFGVDYDANLGKFLAASGNKTQFKNQNYGYVVGNQNPFRFTLKIDALDDDLNPSVITSYQSISKVYLLENGGETLLTGDALAAYVSIDESAGKNSFKFTKAAEGKQFRIETRPLYGVIEGTEATNTKSLTVNVVNAWNVYEAWELNIITNRDDELGASGSGVSQLEVVKNYLANNGVVRPADLGGVVIHKNLTIELSDIPDAYFYTLEADKPYQYEGKDGQWHDAIWQAGTKFFWEQLCVYNYEHTDEVPEFSIYGNYFTVYSYKLPCVAPNGTGNNEDDLSSSQLFKFNTKDTLTDAADFDHTKYTVNIYSLFLRDDDGTDNDNSSSMKHMLGLIAIKTAKCITNVENVNIYAYYISFFADYDCLTIHINECDFYNAWQNHIMAWANNNIDGDNETPHANHTNITINVTKSRLAKCGGPVIINMTKDPEYKAQESSRAEYNIDSESTLFSYVTGQEAWFTALGATSVVSTIKSLNGLLTPGGGSFMTTLPGNGDTRFMNLIMINMVSASDASALLQGSEDVDGKLTIGGKDLLDMNDSAYGKYGNPYVAGYKAHAMLGSAPLFQSSNGTVAAGIIGDATGVDAVTGTPNSVGVSIGNGLVVANGLYQSAETPSGLAAADAAIYSGDYLTLYYGQFGIVFGYNETVEEGSGY